MFLLAMSSISSLLSSPLLLFHFSLSGNKRRNGGIERAQVSRVKVAFPPTCDDDGSDDEVV